MPLLSEIHLFPVKGCRGIRLPSVRLTDRAFEHDREWMIIDGATGLFLTQRELPKMALIGTALETDALHIAIPGGATIGVPFDDPGAREIQAECFMRKTPALDCGDAVAEALTGFLAPGEGKTCRLVRMKPGTVRPNLMGRGSVGFVDAFAVHGVAVESLTDLNAHLPEPLGMDRFRPNLVFTGCEPYEEDAWKKIRIGEMEMTADFRCPRCTVTMVDQERGESAGPEPIKTLADFRKMGNKVMFGMYFTHTAPGELTAGTAIEVLERE